MDHVPPEAISSAIGKGLVRLVRRNVPVAQQMDGCLLDAGREFALIHLFTDRLDLDGYDAVRLDTITSVDDAFPRKQFYEKALALKGIAPSLPPGLNLDDVHSLFASVQAAFTLLVIHQEIVAESAAAVGRLKLSSRRTYALQWLSPEGTWEDDSRSYKYSDVTRVSFGGEYEQTLALVAGLLTPPLPS